MSAITFTMCKNNYITMLTLDTVQVLWSLGLGVQTSAYKLHSFKGKSISYLPCNYIPLALCSLHLICHLQQKWQRFHFHLHFHHETPCQAWVGSKALFSPERRPSSSAVCRGLQYPSSHFSPSTGWTGRARDRLALCFRLCDSLQQGNVTLAHHHGSFCTFILLWAFKRFISL